MTTLIEMLTMIIVILTSAYLFALGAAAIFTPARATRFLLGFASSARSHYTELVFRLIVGASLIIQAPGMAAANAFNLFGWVLFVTAAALLMIPWQWHHRFAQHAVPAASRFITLIGLGSFAIGALILVSLFYGKPA